MKKFKFIFFLILIIFVASFLTEQSSYASVTKEGTSIIYEGTKTGGIGGGDLFKYHWKATFDGEIFIEAWGPKGLNDLGGAGGYASGYLDVKIGDDVYIYLDSRVGTNSADIRLNGTDLDERVLVAGGGGGSNGLVD